MREAQIPPRVTIYEEGVEGMSEDIGARGVVDHARGVLAERFGVAIATADGILHNVARAQRRDVTELAAAVVASCTNGTTPLPRSLYTEGAA